MLPLIALLAPALLIAEQTEHLPAYVLQVPESVPVVLVARTSLGTINHTLLSLEALERRQIGTLGIVFCGESNPDSEGIICRVSGAKRLGRLPRLDPLDGAGLLQAFQREFRVADFMKEVYA